MIKKIKILGFGALVKTFLDKHVSNFPDIVFEIYCRRVPSNNVQANIHYIDVSCYKNDDHPTFFCASVNEAEILEKSNEPSRLSIASANLHLIKSFVEAGFFNTGIHFILTNPSELIAEYIVRHSNNSNIFSCGISVDLNRYQEILPKVDMNLAQLNFNVIGNHWDYPLVNFHDYSCIDKIALLENLVMMLKTKIKNEFNGFKPPVESGAKALSDAVFGLRHGINFPASGYIKKYDVVSGGIFDCSTSNLIQPSMDSITEGLLLNAVNFHKETYRSLVEEMV